MAAGAMGVPPTARSSQQKSVCDLAHTPCSMGQGSVAARRRRIPRSSTDDSLTNA